MNHPNESGIPWLYSASPLPEAEKAQIEGLIAELGGMPPKKALERLAGFAVAAAISGLTDGAVDIKGIETKLRLREEARHHG
jgi:hypothetical protein